MNTKELFHYLFGYTAWESLVPSPPIKLGPPDLEVQFLNQLDRQEIPSPSF